MTKQRKINSTYAIVMVIGLAFMLLFGYLVKPFSTVTVTGVKMLGVLIGLIIITCFNGDLLSGSLMALLATLFHGYYDISGLLSEWLGSVFTVQLVFCGALCLALRDSGAMNVLAKKVAEQQALPWSSCYDDGNAVPCHLCRCSLYWWPSRLHLVLRTGRIHS